MKKTLIVLPLAAALSVAMAPAVAHDPQPVPVPSPGDSRGAPVWLGVAIGPVPQAVQAQLPEDIAPNQGLMVMRVMPGSPARKAGIRPNDVLIRFNGEKLFSPQDLVQRVRTAKPGEQATLEVIRHGKPVKLEVTLEARRPPMARRAPRGPRGMAPTPLPGQGGPNVQSQVWESFQSLSVVKNPDGHYSAVVEFLDPNGDKKRFEYQGTREEIRAQVKKEAQLPDAMKQQLLDALSDQPLALPHEFPPFPDFPDIRQLEREFFQPPPWFNPGRRNPWN